MIFLRFCSCLDLNQMKYNTKMHKRSMWYFCEIYVKIWASAFSVEHVRRTPYQRNKMSFRTFSSLWRELSRFRCGCNGLFYYRQRMKWNGRFAAITYSVWWMSSQLSSVSCWVRVSSGECMQLLALSVRFHKIWFCFEECEQMSYSQPPTCSCAHKLSRPARFPGDVREIIFPGVRPYFINEFLIRVFPTTFSWTFCAKRAGRATGREVRIDGTTEEGRVGWLVKTEATNKKFVSCPKFICHTHQRRLTNRVHRSISTPARA